MFDLCLIVPAIVMVWSPFRLQIQCYHALPYIWCPRESRSDSLWCTVRSGEQTIGAQVVISNISRLADQVQALNCVVMGSNPRAGPAHYQKVRSGFHFWSFSQFFPFDSLDGVPENPGTYNHGVRISVGTYNRGTTVIESRPVPAYNASELQV